MQLSCFLYLISTKFVPLHLTSKLQLLIKRFHQIFVKKGRILGMSTTFFSMIVLNDYYFKLVNGKFPDFLHSLSNAPDLALTHSVFTVPNWTSILLTERHEGHFLGHTYF